MPAADSDSLLDAEQLAQVLDVVAAGIAIMLLIFVLGGRTGEARLLLTVLFTFYVPGRAVVSNWPRMAGWADLAMCIAISLGLLITIALIALWLRAWHPESLFVAEALLSLIGLGVGFIRRRWYYQE
jgi:uncharacterized membrane protein